MQCFCVSSSSWGFRLESSCFLLCHNRNHAAKNEASARLQLCMFAITIIADTMITGQSEGRTQPGRMASQHESLNLLQRSSVRVGDCKAPNDTFSFSSPTATDLHFIDNWLLSKSWTHGLHFLIWSLLTWTTRWPHLPLRMYLMSSLTVIAR